MTASVLVFPDGSMVEPFERMFGRRPGEGRDPYTVTAVREAVRMTFARPCRSNQQWGLWVPAFAATMGSVAQLAASSRTSVKSRIALSAFIGSPKK